MRIKTKISTKPIAFSVAIERFLRVKKATKVRLRTLKDYEIVFNSFLKVSHNTLEFSVLFYIFYVNPSFPLPDIYESTVFFQLYSESSFFRFRTAGNKYKFTISVGVQIP